MPSKEYKTAWFLSSMVDTDKGIYNILSDTLASTRSFRNKQLFFQYMAFLYVSGARRTEPFILDPFIKKFSQHGIDFVKIIRINAKHFVRPQFICVQCQEQTASRSAMKQHLKERGHGQKEGNSYTVRGKRRLHPQIFRIWNPYEKALVDYLLQGREEASLSFTPLLPKSFQALNQKERESALISRSEDKEKYLAGITRRFQMFKARITNGRKTIDGSISPHMLRHTFATNLLAKGEDILVISEELGHSNINTTKIYSRLQLAEIRKEYDRCMN